MIHSRKKPRFILLHPPNQWVVPSHFHGPRSCLGTCSSVVGAISWRHVETDLIQKERKTKKRTRRKTPLVSSLNKSEQIQKTKIQKTNYPKKQKQTNTQEQQQHAFVVPPNSRVVMTSMTVVLPSFCAAHAWRNASPTWSIESTVMPIRQTLKKTCWSGNVSHTSMSKTKQRTRQNCS